MSEPRGYITDDDIAEGAGFKSGELSAEQRLQRISALLDDWDRLSIPEMSSPARQETMRLVVDVMRVLIGQPTP